MGSIYPQPANPGFTHLQAVYACFGQRPRKAFSSRLAHSFVFELITAC